MSIATSANEVKARSQTARHTRGCLYYAKRVALIILVALVAGMAVVVVAWSRGLIQFPALTGTYKVGKADYQLVDESRPEVFSDAPDDRRELMVTVYYPANPPDGAIRELFAQTLGTPGFLQDTVRTHVYTNVPVAEGGAAYPVVIFSPGMGFSPILYAPTLEEVASHGYVVVSLWHPYSTVFTAFPDGRVVRSTAEAGSKALSKAAAQSTTDEEFEAVVNPIGAVWVADVRFVLDQLDTMNKTDSLLAGRLDLSHVGIYGHSFGGGVAAEALRQDERLLAGINLDGTFIGEAAHSGVTRPFMFMLSERVPLTTEQITKSGSSPEAYAYSQRWETTTQNTIYQRATPGYRLVLMGATHRTFLTFEPLAAPVLMLPPELVGKLPGERAARIIGDYVVSFFDQYLKGEAAPLLDGPSPDYPEIAFERHEE